MACRGVHFAITDEDLRALRDAPGDEGVVECIQAIEERWEEGFVCETDKAWDAIHRCLTDGKLGYENGDEPLKWCILGGEQLFQGDGYIIALVTHDRVRVLANALAEVTPEFMALRYWGLPDDYSQPKEAQDLQYTWDWFSGLPELFARARETGRHVIFTVDQ
ncbi:MAG: hypothetical protein JWO82_519 [Akkermansiaceae bacterium]|nr:hypothetical protein [Akkermansiaceae bacterium]